MPRSYTVLPDAIRPEITESLSDGDVVLVSQAIATFAPSPRYEPNFIPIRAAKSEEIVCPTMPLMPDTDAIGDGDIFYSSTPPYTCYYSIVRLLLRSRVQGIV